MSGVQLVPGASHQLAGRAEGINVPRTTQTGAENTATAVDQDGNRTDLQAVPGGDAYSGRVAFGTAADGAAGPGLEVVQRSRTTAPARPASSSTPPNNSGPHRCVRCAEPGAAARLSQRAVLEYDHDQAFNSSAITGSLLVGTMPREVVMSPDGGTAYLADYAEKPIHVIDVESMTVTATIPAPGGPTGSR